MINRIITVCIVLVAFSNLYAQENISINGYVRNYTGVLTTKPNAFSIIQNTLDLTLEKRTDKAALKVNPFLYNYTDRKLEPGLREAYLDLYFTNFDIRVGKQQIIWGKAEGVFITDIVAPKDLREFLLPDFNEIRTGITSFKFNYYKGNHSLEAVWAPVFTPTQMPESSSIWAPEMGFPITPSWDNSTSEITPTLENSEAYLRYSLISSIIDFEMVGGYFFYDDPALHLTKTVNPETMQLTDLTVRPEYHRVAMGGGSFSIPLGGIVFRGEGAFYTGRHFQTTNPLIPDAAVEKSNLHYMAGLDYTLGGVRLSAQLIQEYILDHEEHLYEEEFKNTMTFLARKDFLRERLWIELFTYIGLDNQDALIRPKVTYSFSDGFELLGGANIFVGDQGRFGQYNANDMVYTKIKYSF
ncbi:MAG: DUF1302 family protein [Bacteroidales bacterium]